MPDPMISPQTMSGSWGYTDPTSTWTGSGADAGKTLTATRVGSSLAGAPPDFVTAHAFDTRVGDVPGDVFQTGGATTIDLLLDFGNRSCQLTQWRVYQINNNAATSAIVYESSDNSNWTQIDSQSWSSAAGWKTFNVAGATLKRYLKFTLSATGGYNGFAELELYGLTASGGLFFKGFP